MYSLKIICAAYTSFKTVRKIVRQYAIALHDDNPDRSPMPRVIWDHRG